MPTPTQWATVCTLAKAREEVVRPDRQGRRTPIGDDLRAYLKAELKKPGRSQSAAAAFIGMHQTALNRMVNGGRNILADDLARIEQYLEETKQ